MADRSTPVNGFNLVAAYQDSVIALRVTAIRHGNDYVARRWPFE